MFCGCGNAMVALRTLLVTAAISARQIAAPPWRHKQQPCSARAYALHSTGRTAADYVQRLVFVAYHDRKSLSQCSITAAALVGAASAASFSKNADDHREWVVKSSRLKPLPQGNVSARLSLHGLPAFLQE